MTFLPIVERELRVRARQKATFRVRVGAAGVASLIIVLFLFMIRGWFSPGKMGQGVFWFLSGLAFLWCLFEGPRNTADALSEEKREGTLGLLFLTDLKGYDVVLGKLLATSLNSFYAVLAILPPLGIPLLLGGVTPGEFWRMVLLLIVTLLFSLSAALLISSASRNERRAWFGAILLIGFLAAVPPLFRWVPAPSTMLLGVFSPTPAFYSLADNLFDRRPQPYWYSVMGVHLLSWGFLIAACFVLPHSWQDKPVQKANRELKTRRRLQHEVERRRSMHLNPVVWMLTRGGRADWYVWVVIGVVGLPCVVGSFLWKNTTVLIFPFIGIALALNFLLATWVAAKACFMISDARGSGALDLLLTTPIGPRQIVDGHMEALRRQFMAPFILLTLIEIAALRNFFDFSNPYEAAGEFGLLIIVVLIVSGLFAGQLMAVAWYGLWSGLTTRKVGHAVAKTIIFVVIVPLIFSFAFGCGLLWPVITTVKDAIFINYARSRLHQQFRNIVTEGAPSKTMAWSRPRQWPPKLPNVLDK
jgi:ABC-type transport system involved in multi-copper enzyme maturation permease subunit